MQPLMLAVFLRVWIHSDVAFLSVFCLRVKLLGTDLLLRCQRGLQHFPRKQKTTSGKNLKKADTKGKNKIYSRLAMTCLLLSIRISPASIKHSNVQSQPNKLKCCCFVQGGYKRSA